MPAIITASQLRSVLGVSSSLYSDAYLDEIIDTAEQSILPLLTQWQSSVVEHKCVNDIETITTQTRHNFYVGQVVDISGVGIHSLQNKTVLSVIDEFRFTVAHDIADHTPERVIPAGTAVPNSPTSYVGNASIESAIYAVSIEVFQSRTAAGGQIEGIDFASSPYRMGRSLLNRVVGLLGNYIDVDTMVG
jgi:hypothetical protein